MSFTFEFSNVSTPSIGPLDLVKSLSDCQLQQLSPTWKRFLSSFGSVVSQAQNVASLDPRVHVVVAVAAVTRAIKILTDQADHDDRAEKLVAIMGDLYDYFVDAEPLPKIMIFEKKVERLLTETTECAYFISEYERVGSFIERAAVNNVSDADSRITDFEAVFGEIKLELELILGSSLQAAIDSSRILQKGRKYRTPHKHKPPSLSQKHRL